MGRKAMSGSVIGGISDTQERLDFCGKHGGKDLLERTLEKFRGITSCLSGAKGKGVIYGTGAWNIGDIKGSSAMTQAYEMAKNAYGKGNGVKSFHHKAIRGRDDGVNYEYKRS